MAQYKYKKIVTEGPFGTSIGHKSSDENTVITLGNKDGHTYIYADDLGEQPEELVFEEITLTKEELEFLTNNDVYIKGLQYQTQCQIDQIAKGYPQFERDTFASQESEANAYMKDNEAPTPLIDNLCLIRDIEKSVMVANILANAEASKLAIASIMGHYQKVVNTKGKEVSYE